MPRFTPTLDATPTPSNWTPKEFAAMDITVKETSEWWDALGEYSALQDALNYVRMLIHQQERFKATLMWRESQICPPQEARLRDEQLVRWECCAGEWLAATFPGLHECSPGYTHDSVASILAEAVSRGWTGARSILQVQCKLSCLGRRQESHGQLWRVRWRPKWDDLDYGVSPFYAPSSNPTLLQQIWSDDGLVRIDMDQQAILVSCAPHATREELDFAFGRARDAFLAHRAAEKPPCELKRAIRPKAGRKKDYLLMVRLHDDWMKAGCPSEVGRVTKRYRYNKERLKAAINWLRIDESVADITLNDFLSLPTVAENSLAS